nr:hypothetical protein [Tanacetum cinerariifolium]
MVNPTIYVSCIKQFWSSISLKKTNDVVRLQALIDRKKVIIIEDMVRQVLRLDDADSIDCLPDEKIFAELARMGYEKPYTKLTFYKDDEAEPAELIKVIKVVTTAKLITKVVNAIAATTITAAPMPKASAARRIKGVVIRDPKETFTPSVIMHSEPKYKDKGKGILVEEPKPLKKQAQIE